MVHPNVFRAVAATPTRTGFASAWASSARDAASRGERHPLFYETTCGSSASLGSDDEGHVSWLNDWVDLPETPEALAQGLALLGLPVESLERGATFDRASSWAGCWRRTAPNADRLRLCSVDTGDAVRSVVCGASNVAAGSTSLWRFPARSSRMAPGSAGARSGASSPTA